MPRVHRLLSTLGHEIPVRTEAIASFRQFRIEPARRFGGEGEILIFETQPI